MKEKTVCCGSSGKEEKESCCSIKTPCCGSEKTEKKSQTCCSGEKKQDWITDYLKISEKKVPVIKTDLSTADYLGMIKMRFDIGRNNYKVTPGLYAVGKPDENSSVLVTANYKMTFDLLRKELKGRNHWILVLNTRGINVWCAAGKGTFGTEELIKRIEDTGLSKIVSHREVIAPQLGAPGISAHKVKKESGFKVIYGPVRAKDLPEFIDSGLKATPEMRRVFFSASDRLFLTPVELMGARKVTFLTFIILFLLGGISKNIFSLHNALFNGGEAFLFYIGALFLGAFITPVLLPWIPGRAFSLKGYITGLTFTLIFFSFRGIENPWYGDLNFLSWLILIPAASSFFAMNFTGASTYTSLSGVKKEMKYALPAQLIMIVAGIILWKVSHFL